jgi:DNA mismatch endonuclease (patch repair protein)
LAPTHYCKYGNQVTAPSEKLATRKYSEVERDKVKIPQWKEFGWNVIEIWAECQLEPRRKHSEKRKETFNKLLNKLSE